MKSNKIRDASEYCSLFAHKFSNMKWVENYTLPFSLTYLLRLLFSKIQKESYILNNTIFFLILFSTLLAKQIVITLSLSLSTINTQDAPSFFHHLFVLPMEQTKAETGVASPSKEREEQPTVIVELGSSTAATDSFRLLSSGGGGERVPPSSSSSFHPVDSLSSRQMESLSALCDTFLPSIDVSNDTLDDSIATFFRTSASMVGTPHRVRLHH